MDLGVDFYDLVKCIVLKSSYPELRHSRIVQNHCKECNERKMEQNAMSIFSYEFLPQVCCSTEYTQEGRLKEKLIKIFTCDANRKFDI